MVEKLLKLGWYLISAQRVGWGPIGYIDGRGSFNKLNIISIFIQIYNYFDLIQIANQIYLFSLYRYILKSPLWLGISRMSYKLELYLKVYYSKSKISIEYLNQIKFMFKLSYFVL